MAIPRNRKRIANRIEQAFATVDELDKSVPATKSAKSKPAKKKTETKSTKSESKKKKTVASKKKAPQKATTSQKEKPKDKRVGALKDSTPPIVTSEPEPQKETAPVVIEPPELDPVNSQDPEDHDSVIALQAKLIINNNVLWASGLSVMPVPVLNLATIYVVQLRMAAQLAELHKVPFSEKRMHSIVASLIGSLGASAIAPTLGSLFNFVPIVGPAFSKASLPICAGAVTYAVGQVLNFHFEIGGNLLDFDTDLVREYFYIEFRSKLSGNA